MMSKAYVITSGCYSAYHICGVTLDKHKAETLKTVYEKIEYEEVNIEEYELDAHYDRFESGCKMYLVQFDCEGNIHQVCGDCSPDDESIYETWGGHYINVFVWAKDQESAVKIAAEKRAKYLAEKEGIA